MKKRSVTLVVLLFLGSILPVINVYAVTAIVFVQPSVTTVQLFDSFEVNVSISDVTDLAGWDFRLYYPSSHLNGTSVAEGQFLKQVSQTSGLLVTQFSDHYNATHGIVWLVCTLIGQGAGASGSGVLAKVTFKAVGGGTALLHIGETDLVDSTMPPNHILCTTADGTVEVPQVDVAVTDYRIWRTIVGDSTDHPCFILMNVTVQNQGVSSGVCDICVYANSNIVCWCYSLPLGVGETVVVNFNWTNPYGYSRGNYTMSACVSPILGETDLDDNQLVGHWLFITIPGDCNGDKKVNVLDLISIAVHLGHTGGDGHMRFSEDWFKCMNTDVLVDGNCAHNVLDLIRAAKYLGSHW